MKSLEKIKNDEISVECFNGYVCKFSYQGYDLIHGGGLPKELRSEEDNLRINKGAPEYSNITVFPFGGIPEKVFVREKEITKKEMHGLSRSLLWEDLLENGSKEQIIFRQTCDGETSIKNIKYDPSKGNPEFLDSMFPFEIWRGYNILRDKILHNEIDIVNRGNSFKYSLWDHPIFISPNDLKKGYFHFEYKNKKNNLNLEEVSKLKGNVKLLDGIENILFINYESGVGFNFKSRGFGNLMIWSPKGKGIFSIESKSHPGVETVFPSEASQTLDSNSSKNYFIDIIPFLEQY